MEQVENHKMNHVAEEVLISANNKIFHEYLKTAYQVGKDDIRDLVNQQWRVANYMILLMIAIVGLSEYKMLNDALLSNIVMPLAGIAILLIVHFQLFIYEIHCRRKRLREFIKEEFIKEQHLRLDYVMFGGGGESILFWMSCIVQGALIMVIYESLWFVLRVLNYPNDIIQLGSKIGVYAAIIYSLFVCYNVVKTYKKSGKEM